MIEAVTRMLRFSKRAIFIIAFVALGVVRNFCSSDAALAVSAELRPVVSYLVSATRDPKAWMPDEPGNPFRVPPHPWNWRIFDPASGRDTLFLTLPSFPLLMRWDPQFAYVEFILGDRAERVPWALGGKMVETAVLPVDSAYCDFWADSMGQFHLLTCGIESVRSWDRARSGRWHLAAVDSPATEFCIPANPSRAGQRPSIVTVTSLLDSMRIESHWNVRLQSPCAGVPQAHCAWVPSGSDTTIGIEVWYDYGDSFHAMEPVFWVDRAHGRHKEVYGVGQSHDETAGQLAFAERRDFLLVVAEYSGAYPAVVDMRSGDVVFRTDEYSGRAVWVPPPRGWGH